MRTKSAGLMPSGIVAFRMPNGEILRRVTILLKLQAGISIVGTRPPWRSLGCAKARADEFAAAVAGRFAVEQRGAGIAWLAGYTREPHMDAPRHFRSFIEQRAGPTWRSLSRISGLI
jgi:hypothetical protein